MKFTLLSLALFIGIALSQNEPCTDSISCQFQCSEGQYSIVAGDDLLGLGPAPTFGCTTGNATGGISYRNCIGGGIPKRAALTSSCFGAGGRVCYDTTTAPGRTLVSGCILRGDDLNRFDASCKADNGTVKAIDDGLSMGTAFALCGI